MKINNKKIIVSTLALAVGAALAGSISGSVAWYQYSTRASASIAGTSAGTSRQLYVKSAQASQSDYNQSITFNNVNFRPVSYYKNGAANEWYERPVADYSSASIAQTAVSTNEQTINDGTNNIVTYAYAQYTLYFQVKDVVNGTTAYKAKDVYLTGFELTADSDQKDVTPAVRVLIDGTNDFNIAKAEGTTTTHGNLDLNGNGTIDKYNSVLVDDSAGTAINYYAGAADSSYDSVLASSAMPTTTNPYTFSDTTNKALTTTLTEADATSSEYSAAVVVTIWLEGWDTNLNATGSTIWDQAYLNQTFTLNMQFGCEADIA